MGTRRETEPQKVFPMSEIRKDMNPKGTPLEPCRPHPDTKLLDLEHQGKRKYVNSDRSLMVYVERRRTLNIGRTNNVHEQL